MPPVWPRPRPLSCGTAAPQAATSGASGRVILSPTPPVECLSVVGRPPTDSGGNDIRIARRDHRVGPPRDLAPVHAVEQDRHREGGHLLVGDLAAGVGGDHPVDLLVGEGLPVPLGADDLDRGETHSGPPRERERSERSRGDSLMLAPPGRRARRRPGSTSLIGRTPRTVSSSRSGPPFSQRSCRQRPQGISGLPCWSTQDTATSRPPPLECRAETRPHSAHRPTP